MENAYDMETGDYRDLGNLNYITMIRKALYLLYTKYDNLIHVP